MASLKKPKTMQERNLIEERRELGVALIWLAQQTGVIPPGSGEIRIPENIKEMAEELEVEIAAMIDHDTQDVLCYTVRLSEG